MRRARARSVLLATLIAAATPGGNALAASPRQEAAFREDHVVEPEEVLRARKNAQMEAWLRRLIGRFWVEPSYGEKRMQAVLPDMVGSATIVDCISIGTGPGVHCIFYTPNSGGTWKERAHAKGNDSADEALQPGKVLRVSSVVEYGLDPNAGRIRMMSASPLSARLLGGVLSNDTLTFLMCESAAQRCTLSQSIDAPADGGDLGITYAARGLRERSILHRMSADEAGEAGRRIDAAQWDDDAGANPGKSTSGPATFSRKNAGRPR